MNAYRPSTISMLVNICCRRFGASLPMRSVKYARSTANSCDAFATESFGKPATFAGSIVLPGASAQAKLLVSGTQTTVASRLRLRGLPCTITTGLRKPAEDPDGIGKSAHQISPWWISTIRCGRERIVQRPAQRDHALDRTDRRPGSSHRLLHRAHGD